MSWATADLLKRFSLPAGEVGRRCALPGHDASCGPRHWLCLCCQRCPTAAASRPANAPGMSSSPPAEPIARCAPHGAGV